MQTVILCISIFLMAFTFLIHLGLSCIYSSKPGELTVGEWFWRLLTDRWTDYYFPLIYILFAFCIWRTW